MEFTNLFYFAHGICSMFFLMLSVYFLRGERSRLKQLLGYILLIWFLLLVKDLFFLKHAIRTDEYSVRLLLSIDLLALPTGTFFLFELLKPYTVTWKTIWTHELPFLLLILLYALTEDTGLYYFILLFGLAYGLTIVYFVLKKMKLYNIVLKENYSNTDNVNVRWLTTTSILLVACMFAWTITSFYVTDWGDTCYYFFCCYIWGFISFRTKHQEIASREFFDEPDNSYEQNNQCNNEAKQNNVNSLILKLEETLSDKKLYHNPRLTLQDTAKELGTNRTYLSSCLNNELHTTFYDYINSFRLKEVEEMFHSQEYINCTIEELAQKCGFNSASTFRRAFVKTYGCTPLKYRKKCEITTI
ncbi:helix-turn-helix domain-containing protein [Barnesiella propionica]|uniref:helix-turn-helix domain-containing protein n=1 Tax=Barnesiella propionica TaxID=2981781 RepID=UPI0011C96734|nr:helix-turn-helix domain-containing protein [Barnesiella propionica]MCU6768697.1 helix-turn-helix domain-containing protein [Barnesiella propionica]